MLHFPRWQVALIVLVVLGGFLACIPNFFSKEQLAAWPNFLPKKQIVQMLVDSAPSTLNSESVARVDTLDGVKFYLSDNSWLLIRPSGTEPLLRIYAEAHTHEAVKSLLEAGDLMGKQLTSGA